MQICDNRLLRVRVQTYLRSERYIGYQSAEVVLRYIVSGLDTDVE